MFRVFFLGGGLGFQSFTIFFLCVCVCLFLRGFRIAGVGVEGCRVLSFESSCSLCNYPQAPKSFLCGITL